MRGAAARCLVTSSSPDADDALRGQICEALESPHRVVREAPHVVFVEHEGHGLAGGLLRIGELRVEPDTDERTGPRVARAVVVLVRNARRLTRGRRTQRTQRTQRGALMRQSANEVVARSVPLANGRGAVPDCAKLTRIDHVDDGDRCLDEIVVLLVERFVLIAREVLHARCCVCCARLYSSDSCASEKTPNDISNNTASQSFMFFMVV